VAVAPGIYAQAIGNVGGASAAADCCACLAQPASILVLSQACRLHALQLGAAGAGDLWDRMLSSHLGMLCELLAAALRCAYREQMTAHGALFSAAVQARLISCEAGVTGGPLRDTAAAVLAIARSAGGALRQQEHEQPLDAAVDQVCDMVLAVAEVLLACVCAECDRVGANALREDAALADQLGAASDGLQLVLLCILAGACGRQSATVQRLACAQLPREGEAVWPCQAALHLFGAAVDRTTLPHAIIERSCDLCTQLSGLVLGGPAQRQWVQSRTWLLTEADLLCEAVEAQPSLVDVGMSLRMLLQSLVN
jgi:hypothetical protein